MIDEKHVETRSQEIHKIIHEIILKDMTLDGNFQVFFIIDKLSPLKRISKNLYYKC